MNSIQRSRMSGLPMHHVNQRSGPKLSVFGSPSETWLPAADFPTANPVPQLREPAATGTTNLLRTTAANSETSLFLIANLPTISHICYRMTSPTAMHFAHVTFADSLESCSPNRQSPRNYQATAELCLRYK